MPAQLSLCEPRCWEHAPARACWRGAADGYQHRTRATLSICSVTVRGQLVPTRPAAGRRRGRARASGMRAERVRVRAWPGPPGPITPAGVRPSATVCVGEEAESGGYAHPVQGI